MRPANKNLKVNELKKLATCYSMQILLSLFFVALSLPCFATEYYVSGSGSDSKNGLSSSTAFRTLQKAADLTNPGDTVWIMNGTYKNSWPGAYVLEINRSGNSNAYITYSAMAGHKPLLYFGETTRGSEDAGWAGIRVTASYIKIIGLEVKGNNGNMDLDRARSIQNSNGGNGTAESSGNAIIIHHPSNTLVHHVIVSDNIVHSAGSGIGCAHADYITIERNRVFDNAWYSSYANSGISLFEMKNFDNFSGVKNIVRANVSYNNASYLPWKIAGLNVPSDGNGIILDTALSGYVGRTLVANNLVYNNGGSGIHAYIFNNVDIVNNTSYQNTRVMTDWSEIFQSNSSGGRILNNIIYSRSGAKQDFNWSASGLVSNYNLVYNARSISSGGSQDVVADPRFVNASQANFALQETSPAIDAGTQTAQTPVQDINGNSRPFGAANDLGAFEYSGTEEVLNPPEGNTEGGNGSDSGNSNGSEGGNQDSSSVNGQSSSSGSGKSSGGAMGGCGMVRQADGSKGITSSIFLLLLPILMAIALRFNRFRQFLLSLSGFVIIISYQACTPMNSSINKQSLSSDTEAVIESFDGVQFYQKVCAQCHMDIQNTRIPGRSPSQISIALQTVTDMKYLSSYNLNQQQIEAISKALGFDESSSKEIPLCESTSELPVGQLFRLTKTQYALMLEQIFGISNGMNYLSNWPSEYSTGIFSNNGLGLDVNEILLTELMSINEKLLDDVWNNTNLRSRILSCSLTSATCVNGEIKRFLEKAFRHPVESAEFDSYRSLYDKVLASGGSSADAYKVVLQTVLVSPSFIYNAYVRGQNIPGDRKKLTDIELANRISFMLWGMGPDDELYEVAIKGELQNLAQLQKQIRRMLQDSRSKYFAEHYFKAWLTPDSPSVQVSSFVKMTNINLKNSLDQEMVEFINDFIRRDAPMVEVLSGQYTYVNSTLAGHYGVTGSFSSTFDKVNLPSASGILSQGRVLSATGREDSVVNVILRGKWLMDKMLCEGPPPPANLMEIAEILESELEEGLSNREMAHLRSSRTACATCHVSMDNYGFTFEAFDSFGRIKSGSIDNHAVMSDGKEVSGIQQLSHWLQSQDQTKACFAKQMGSYVYSRPFAEPDECVANKIGIDNWSLPISSWLTQFVKSDGFQQVR